MSCWLFDMKRPFNNSISAPATLSKWRNFKGVALTQAGFERRKVWGTSGHGSSVKWGGSIRNNKRLCDIIEPRDGRPSHIFPDQYVCSLLSPQPERQMTSGRKCQGQIRAGRGRAKQECKTGRGKEKAVTEIRWVRKKRRKDRSWKKEVGVAARSHACDSSEWSNSIGPSNRGGDDWLWLPVSFSKNLYSFPSCKEPSSRVWRANEYGLDVWAMAFLGWFWSIQQASLHLL